LNSVACLRDGPRSLPVSPRVAFLMRLANDRVAAFDLTR